MKNATNKPMIIVQSFFSGLSCSHLASTVDYVGDSWKIMTKLFFSLHARTEKHSAFDHKRSENTA